MANVAILRSLRVALSRREYLWCRLCEYETESRFRIVTGIKYWLHSRVWKHR